MTTVPGPARPRERARARPGGHSQGGSDGLPVRVVVRGSAGWPDRLEHLTDPPEGIWLAGSGALADRMVAVVGARRATLSGLEVARDLARDLAAAGVQVVSGMARGIDAAAHRGALDGGGSTVAVLGCGVDVCYPPEHRPLRDAVVARGLVVAEDPPGTEPAPWRFPRRNRLIAALAMAVVVVEAGERSGALSTARHAADLGRDVLAVPGSVRSPQSVGVNRLIRDGAVPLLETGDLFAAVPALAPPTAPGVVPPGVRTGSPLDPALEGLLDLLGPQPAHPDALAAAAGRPAAEVAAQLATLEVLGLAATVPGGLVRLTGAV